MQEIDSKIIKYIVFDPVMVVKILEVNGYKVSEPISLQKINKEVFKGIYQDKNPFLINDLLIEIRSEGFSNFEPITMGISAGLSIISSVIGAKQAKKALELQRKIALANLSQQQLLGEESIRTGAETERTKILLQTLQQYQSDLQTQSTERLKNVWIYVGMLGASIALIWGTTTLLTTKSE